MHTPGTLYLIPNTLGSHSDDAALLRLSIPDTVLQTAASLDYWIVENAKTARAHLKRIAQLYPLNTPLQQIEMAELSVKTPSDRLPQLLAPLLAGKQGGLMSEAGVPAVADPGANLIRLAHKHAIPVKPLVGPSSLLLALMGSGLNGQRFAFQGYLPTDAQQRAQHIVLFEKQSRKDQQTQLFIETPYRNEAVLEALCQHCQPQTRLCIATDLSLPTEHICTLPIAQWRQRLAQNKLPDIHRKPSIFLLLAS